MELDESARAYRNCLTSMPFCCAPQLLMFNEPLMKSFCTSTIRNALIGRTICKETPKKKEKKSISFSLHCCHTHCFTCCCTTFDNECNVLVIRVSGMARARHPDERTVLGTKIHRIMIGTMAIRLKTYQVSTKCRQKAEPEESETQLLCLPVIR